MDFERRTDRRSDADETDATPSETVIWAVSEAENVDPTNLRSLNEVVDPDALDTLFSESSACSVTFEYQGYTVTVREDDEVIVQARPAIEE